MKGRASILALAIVIARGACAQYFPPSGGASASGSLGCVQLYATSTSFTGCSGTTEALIGNVDPGADILGVASTATKTTLSDLVDFDYSLSPATNHIGSAYATYTSLEANGAVNFPGAWAAWVTLNENNTGTAGIAGNPNSALAASMNVNIGLTSGYIAGIYSLVSDGPGTTTQAAGVWSALQLGATITSAFDYYAQAPLTPTGTSTYYSYWSDAVGGLGATNAFPLWFDEQGVFAVHSINAFNAVYQARPALYNPQFTKFTPGTANYDRVVLQYESNEAVLRTEAGGTGTLRRLGLGGAGLDILTGDVANPLVSPKTSVAASAPGAAKADLRWLAGTNAGTCKLVGNAGTSATEVTIVDNVGGGC